jgi:hypothetical protein
MKIVDDWNRSMNIKYVYQYTGIEQEPLTPTIKSSTGEINWE